MCSSSEIYQNLSNNKFTLGISLKSNKQCSMLCAPLDWKYAELPSSASDAVLCSVLVRKMWDI